MKRRLAGLTVFAALVLVAIGVGVSYGAKKETTTLTMWSYDNQDPGLEPVLKQLSKEFEQSHPGVKINLVFKDFNGLVGTVPRALASGSGPDVTEGNQGYQTDAQLVKAKLIIPLDKYVKKYGWDKLYAPSTWGMFRWTPDGKSFGKGPIWGIAQTGQNVVVFYNKKKFRQAGLNPNRWPSSYAGFEAMLATLRAKLPSSDPVIEEGNKEGYGFIHLFGGIWGASVEAAGGAQLDLPRPRLPLRLARHDQGADAAAAVGEEGATSTRTTTPSGTTRRPSSSPRARVRCGSAATGTRPSSRRASAPPMSASSPVPPGPAASGRRSAGSRGRGTSRRRRRTPTSGRSG